MAFDFSTFYHKISCLRCAHASQKIPMSAVMPLRVPQISLRAQSYYLQKGVVYKMKKSALGFVYGGGLIWIFIRGSSLGTKCRWFWSGVCVQGCLA